MGNCLSTPTGGRSIVTMRNNANQQHAVAITQVITSAANINQPNAREPAITIAAAIATAMRNNNPQGALDTIAIAMANAITDINQQHVLDLSNANASTGDDAVTMRDDADPQRVQEIAQAIVRAAASSNQPLPSDPATTIAPAIAAAIRSGQRGALNTITTAIVTAITSILGDLRAQHDAELVVLREEILDDVHAQHEKILDDVRAQHDAELVALREEIATLRDQIAALQPPAAP